VKSADAVKKLVAEQLERIADPTRRAALAVYLVEPYAQKRRWDAGPNAATYEVWIIGKPSFYGDMLAYSEEWFDGLRWGFVSALNDWTGGDDQWDETLDEAFTVGGMDEAPPPAKCRFIEELARLKKLVEEEVQLVRDTNRRAALHAAILHPMLTVLRSDEQRGPEKVPCWIVSRFVDHVAALMWCPQVLDAANPWCFMNFNRGVVDRDVKGYASLDAAFINSGMWKGPLPPGYEVE
jgi:hypothetical protein